MSSIFPVNEAFAYQQNIPHYELKTQKQSELFMVTQYLQATLPII
jgi:hypothetical protein